MITQLSAVCNRFYNRTSCELPCDPWYGTWKNRSHHAYGTAGLLLFDYFEVRRDLGESTEACGRDHMAGRNKKVGASLPALHLPGAMGTAEQRKEALLLRSRCDDYWKGTMFLGWQKIYFLILTWSSLMSCRASSPRRHRGSKTWKK